MMTTPDRMIIHLDLDAFYAQVESIRLGLSHDVPLAVQQWGRLLAVNYAARPYGVKRFENITEARIKCRDIALPHVDTLPSSSSNNNIPDQATQKATLKRYRDASKAIFTVFNSYFKDFQDVTLEKASIDEVYIDITSVVAERRIQRNTLAVVLPTNTKVIGNSAILPSSLLHGANVANDVRKAVYDALGYTLSAGISSNKLLAKTASSVNKPNGQCVLPFGEDAVTYLATLKIEDVQGFGGKLGKDLCSRFNITSVKSLQCISEEVLRVNGFSADKNIYGRCRGDDGDAPVVRKSLPASLISVKNFREGFDLKEKGRYWASILVTELLLDRVATDTLEYCRVPTRLVVSHARVRSTTSLVSKTIVLKKEDLMNVSGVSELVLKVLLRDDECTSTTTTIYNLTLIAKSFVSTKSQISNYLDSNNINSDVFEKFITRQEEIRVREEERSKRIQEASTERSSLLFDRFEKECKKRKITAAPSPKKRGGSVTKGGDGVYWCSKCLRNIPIASIEEHSDFHVALSLASSSSSSSTCDGISTKKFTSGRKRKGKLITTIRPSQSDVDSFFKK